MNDLLPHSDLIPGIEFGYVPKERLEILSSLNFTRKKKILILYPEGLLATLSCLSGEFARRLHIFLINLLLKILQSQRDHNKNLNIASCVFWLPFSGRFSSLRSSNERRQLIQDDFVYAF